MGGHKDILRQDQGGGTSMALHAVAWGGVGVRWGDMGWAQGLLPELGLSQPLPSERPWPDVSSAPPTPSTRQPLTQLIAGLAAGTAGLVVVFPGQKGALWTGEAGGRATRLLCRGPSGSALWNPVWGQSRGFHLPLPISGSTFSLPLPSS